MTNKKAYLILLLPFLIIGTTLKSQTADLKDTNQFKTPDPISAMLDSMTAQKFLSRADFVEATRNLPFPDKSVPYEFKSFPDSVYKKNLAKLQSPIPMDYNDQVRAQIDMYAKRPYSISKLLGLANLYFPMFEEVLDKEGLPLEFKYLAIVESALNPVAHSWCGATGLWQFMYTTGILYDLKVTSYIDERKDPYKATMAACQYFKDMYLIYKDWLLVIAAYNCGAGNVNRAIMRAGGSKDFWEISKYLPYETRSYVPAFIAVNYVMNYAKDYNITPEAPVLSFFQVDTITVSQPVTLKQVSKTLNIPQDVLEYLNPIYTRGYIPALDATQKLRLPYNKVGIFMANADGIYKASYMETASAYTQQQNSKPNGETVIKDIEKTYIVKSGESIPVIAGRFEISSADLMKWNHLSSSLIYPGQKLIIQTKEVVKVEKPTAKDSIAAVASKDSITKSKDSVAVVKTDSVKTQKTNVTLIENNAASTKYIYYMVQPGDTLWNIAQKYQGVTVQQLKDINKLSEGHVLLPGTKLKVQVGG